MGLGVFTLFGIVYPLNFFLAVTTVKLAVSSSPVDTIRLAFPQHTYWVKDLDFAVGCRTSPSVLHFSTMLYAGIGVSLLMAYSLVSVASGVRYPFLQSREIHSCPNRTCGDRCLGQIQATSPEGYDNHYGRFQMARAKPGLGLRMYASHYNALECFTMFSIAVIVGILRGVDGHLLANLSVVVILARKFYHIFHALDFAMLRSIAFDTAFMAILTIIMEAAVPGNAVVKFMTNEDWTLPNFYSM
ncbi:hypothetical protein FOZ60_002571 [Perkinsus olseni]|uniref:Uncharacterized protein n=1 Tax=Perkinsus olseni TaxID=32597 RepID=A0A7J6NYJ8_PEROL|nr:hypothetical protein FOZ60_002571 [Perkinsus olseni]